MKTFMIDGNWKLDEIETTLNGSEEYGFIVLSLTVGPEEAADDKGKLGPVNWATLERKKWGKKRPDLALEIIDDVSDFGSTLGSRAADGWTLQFGPSPTFVKGERVDVAIFRKI